LNKVSRLQQVRNICNGLFVTPWLLYTTLNLLSWCMDGYEEDPVELYNREFQRKRWEAAQVAKTRKIKRERLAHRFARYCSFPIIIFAFILLLDKYLPTNIHNEVAELGWQARGSGKHPILYSYMQTKSFTFVVPHKAHLDYPYYDESKPILKIEVTPIFNVPIHASYTLGDYLYSFVLPDNIHTIFIPLSWLLFISAAFTILAKNYSRITYSLVFLPILLLALVLLKLL
jgi:hypothetical protein